MDVMRRGFIVLKAYIFGAGDDARALFARVQNGYEILGFWDNDKRKQESSLFGLPVSAPNTAIEFDVVIIGTYYHYHQIREQLLQELRIPAEKLLIYNPERFIVSYARRCALQNARAIIDYRCVPGNVAELGVYHGDFAKEINRNFPERTLYLFDTFEGFRARDIEADYVPNTVQGEFGDTTVELCLSKMAFRDKCVVKKGWFPDTAKGIDDTFAFVSLDADLYAPILEGLKFFVPRLEKGGYIFVHDFFSPYYHGAKKAVYEYLSQHDLAFSPLGDRLSISITK